MTEAERIAEAEAEVERAKQAVVGTVREITQQFEPHRLIREMWEDAKDKGAGLAEEAVDAIRARPLASTGVVAAIAMFLAREPLIDLAGKLTGGKAKKKSGGKQVKGKRGGKIKPGNRKPKAQQTEKTND